MLEISNELLVILWDTNGYSNKKESEKRMLDLLNNASKIHTDFTLDRKLDHFRVTINNLPEKEQEFFEKMVKKFKELKNEHTSN
jgi:hypothetical protein